MFKLFRREEEKKGPKIGDRFAYRYKSLESPLASIENVGDDRGDIFELIQEYKISEMGDLGNLYTVIEYIGDNQYKDLITGEVFINKRFSPQSIKDTVTQSTEIEALTMKKYLVEHPVAISEPFVDLTPEMKTKIMEETIPRKEELTAVMRDVMNDASQKVAEFYEKIDGIAMNAMYNNAVKEDKERTREKERIAAEEEAKIKDERLRAEKEEQRRIKEAHEAEVANDFEQYFSSNSKIR